MGPAANEVQLKLMNDMADNLTWQSRAGAVRRRQGVDHRDLQAFLAQTVFSGERHSLAGRERLSERVKKKKKNHTRRQNYTSQSPHINTIYS